MESSVFAAPTPGTATPVTADNISVKAQYAPPWADVSIIGIAGSSGSGKSTISQAIVKRLNLPWVVILSMVSLFSSCGNSNRGPSRVQLILIDKC